MKKKQICETIMILKLMLGVALPLSSGPADHVVAPFLSKSAMSICILNLGSCVVLWVGA
jgi:hypothetical protein